MTQQEILEYNKRCAEFLGKDKKGTQDVTWTFPDYLNGQLWVDEHFFNNTDEYCGRRQTKVSELKFHSDWNWIMEVVEAIDKTQHTQLDILGKHCRISSKGIDFQSSSKEDKKKAVVQAINQFLIWYNENSKNTVV